MKRTVGRRRNRNLPTNPKRLVDLGDIPEEFKVTKNNKKFLCFDSYLDEDSEDDEDDEAEEDQRRREKRILIYATKADLKILAASSTWYIDGTFDTAPDIFTQVLTIHGEYLGEVVPLVYALLPDKAQETYTRFMDGLLDACEKLHIRRPNPEVAILDFEKAVINVLMLFFVDAVVRLCLFHLKQSAFRKIQDLGLQAAYRDEEDESVRDAFRQILGVAFVPTDDVPEAFAEARADIPASMEEFANYFEETYVLGRRLRGRRQRTAPRFPPHQWNQHNAALHKDPRTNNSKEGWHNRFQVTFIL